VRGKKQNKNYPSQNKIRGEKDKDFMMHLKKGKRIHLCEYEVDSLADGLNGLHPHTHFFSKTWK